MKRCKKLDELEIPPEINGDLRLAIQHLREVGDYRQRETVFKFKIVFWMMGLLVGMLGVVIGLLVTVALQI